jgi:hypothetical protein
MNGSRTKYSGQLVTLRNIEVEGFFSVHQCDQTESTAIQAYPVVGHTWRYGDDFPVVGLNRSLRSVRD